MHLDYLKKHRGAIVHVMLSISLFMLSSCDVEAEKSDLSLSQRDNLENILSWEKFSNVDMMDKNFTQQTLVPYKYETHGGENVAIYARGPSAHLIRGVVEENYIFHVMYQLQA